MVPSTVVAYPVGKYKPDAPRHHTITLLASGDFEDVSQLFELAEAKGIIDGYKIDGDRVDVRVSVTADDANEIWTVTRGEIEAPTVLPACTRRVIEQLEALA